MNTEVCIVQKLLARLSFADGRTDEQTDLKQHAPAQGKIVFTMYCNQTYIWNSTQQPRRGIISIFDASKWEVSIVFPEYMDEERDN